MDKGGGYKDFPPKIVCLTLTKNSLGDSFSVSLLSVIEKFYGKKGGYKNFPSKIFCLTVPKIFAGESFRVSLPSGIEKF